MNLLAPKSKWFDDWFPEWNPGYMIQPLHGDALPSQIRIDVSETEDAYEVKADMPGVSKDDIDLQIMDGLVSISAEVKQEDRQAENGRLLRSERYFGRVSRSFELPGAVDTNASEANFTDGVLSLLLPKAEPKLKQHKIDIK